MLQSAFTDQSLASKTTGAPNQSGLILKDPRFKMYHKDDLSRGVMERRKKRSSSTVRSRPRMVYKTISIGGTHHEQNLPVSAVRNEESSPMRKFQ
jgi:hypothetical protein